MRSIDQEIVGLSSPSGEEGEAKAMAKAESFSSRFVFDLICHASVDHARCARQKYEKCLCHGKMKIHVVGRFVRFVGFVAEG